MWYCANCKMVCDIIADTYDIPMDKDTPPDKVGEIIRDMIEWDIVCAECECPAEWRD